MRISNNEHNRWAIARANRRARRAVHHEREALARDLAAFESRAELVELSATLQRYPDAETETIRGLVDWTRAA